MLWRAAGHIFLVIWSLLLAAAWLGAALPTHVLVFIERAPSLDDRILAADIQRNVELTLARGLIGEVAVAGERVAWITLQGQVHTLAPGERPRVYHNPAPAYDLRWNGTDVLFQYNEAGERSFVYRLGDPPKLVYTSSAGDLSLRIAPDGERWLRREWGRLWLDGSAISDAVSGPASWSPDGNAVAFLENTGEILLVVVDANTRRRVRVQTSGGFHLSPAWTPDGTHLAYTTSFSNTNRLMLTPLDGGPEQVVADSVVPQSIALRPDGEAVAAIRFTAPRTLEVIDLETGAVLWQRPALNLGRFTGWLALS